jgi:hypothetical protein
LLKRKKENIRFVMPEESNQNQQSVNAPDTWSAFLFLLITTKQGWLGITGVAAVVTAAMLIAMQFIRPEKIIVPETIDISTTVGSISIKKGNTQNALFLLSPNGGDANTPWVETGIEVKKGDVIKITASGRVHTSITRLVAATRTPEVDEQSWTSPEGLKLTDNPNFPPAFDKQKLLPDKNGAFYGFGMLLAAVRDSKQQVKEDDIEPIGENGELKANIDGKLVLTVNDIWLDKEDKDTYALPFNENFKYYQQLAHYQAAFKGEDFDSWSKETERKKAEEQYQKRFKSWGAIDDNDNWNVWYDNNIGAFSVSITVNEKE